MMDRDRQDLPRLLDLARREALSFLDGLDERPVAHEVPAIEPLGLPDAGLGGEAALEVLRRRYAPWASSSPGPRYFAFVTGGATPAALLGDWLTAAWDQNLSDAAESGSRQLALDALAMVRDLLGLPQGFGGAFVTGATTSNLVALASGREWLGRQRGVRVSEQGVAALGPVRVLAATAHSSVYKTLSVLGLGRSCLQTVATLPGREAVDVAALEQALAAAATAGVAPCLVVASAGTVNTCDFDDLAAIAALRHRFPFWLHVDGAFGALAAASPAHRHLVDGLAEADSITFDGHKWLNVPYDSAVVLSRHRELQGAVFSSLGPYLPPRVQADTFLHLTPENSQRLRALATWMTLAAYGRDGYAELVERCCALAGWLGERLAAHPAFELLAPVRLNGVCFTLAGSPTAEQVDAYLAAVKADGTAFLTSTVLRGTPAIRLSITNWRTRREDVESTWEALLRCLPSAHP